jgi:hypothetical protein
MLDTRWLHTRTGTPSINYLHDRKPCDHSTVADYFLAHDYGFPVDILGTDGSPDRAAQLSDAVNRDRVQAIPWPDKDDPLTALYVTRSRAPPDLERVATQARFFYGGRTTLPVVATAGAFATTIGDDGHALAGIIYALHRGWIRELTRVRTECVPLYITV